MSPQFPGWRYFRSMKFEPTKFEGLYVITPELATDNRGYFSRFYCKESFDQMGIISLFSQSSISYNRQKGTLRGLHFQSEPYEEEKIVKCIRGSIYDVVIDLRKSSGTYKQWFSMELTADNRKSLFIPKGFAHGFQTLEDDSEVLYQISGKYMPDHGMGIRWDDEAFKIEWPLEIRCVSDKDLSFPPYS